MTIHDPVKHPKDYRDLPFLKKALKKAILMDDKEEVVRLRDAISEIEEEAR